MERVIEEAAAALQVSEKPAAPLCEWIGLNFSSGWAWCSRCQTKVQHPEAAAERLSLFAFIDWAQEFGAVHSCCEERA